jgi:putative hydrolase of the HAD superfamily
VCFDLDDTLSPQAPWLHGAWRAVAARAARDGVDEAALFEALVGIAAEGSDRGRIIDRALEQVGAADRAVGPLLDAFRGYRPTTLDPYPGVGPAVERLAARVPLGLVSDGDPAIQQAKLDALGLAGVFSAVVWSDEHGREHRKPDPLPFRLAVERLGVDARDTVFIGDRPEKDVRGAAAAGLAPIRVRTGEWSSHPDLPDAWAVVDTACDACALVEATLDQASSTATSTRKSRSPGTSR